MAVYLTTDLQTENAYFLNDAANFALSPVRHFFGGRTVWVINNAMLWFELPESNRSWLETAAMIAAFIPGLLCGIAARCTSLLINEIRSGFNIIQNGPLQEDAQQFPEVEAEVDVGLLPFNAVVDKDITFFKELLAVPDNQLKAWLEDKKTDRTYTNPFHGASVIAESKISFEEVNSQYLTELLELFAKAADRLQKLGLNNSSSQSVIEEPQPPVVAVAAIPAPAVVAEKPISPPKAAKPPSSEMLKMFAKVQGVLSEQEFAHICTKYGHDPKAITEILNESKRRAYIQRTTDLAIVFFLELRDDVADNKVAEWLMNKKSAKNYPYPFHLAAKSLQDKARYHKILGNAAYQDLTENYGEASYRLKKLGLAAFLIEKPPGR